jgi:hypothetical protein
MNLCATKSESPLLGCRIFNGPFNRGVVMHEMFMSLSSEKILDVLSDDRMVAERSIFSVTLNGPF